MSMWKCDDNGAKVSPYNLYRSDWGGKDDMIAMSMRQWPIGLHNNDHEVSQSNKKCFSCHTIYHYLTKYTTIIVALIPDINPIGITLCAKAWLMIPARITRASTFESPFRESNQITGANNARWLEAHSNSTAHAKAKHQKSLKVYHREGDQSIPHKIYIPECVQCTQIISLHVGNWRHHSVTK